MRSFVIEIKMCSFLQARRGQLDELQAQEEAEKRRREEAEALAQVSLSNIHLCYCDAKYVINLLYLEVEYYVLV